MSSTYREKPQAPLSTSIAAKLPKHPDILNISGEWYITCSSSSSSPTSSPSLRSASSLRRKAKGSYETFIPLLPFHASRFDECMRDMKIEQLVELHNDDQEFRFHMIPQHRLDYLAERFLLEHCCTFEKLMASYEMRRCLSPGSIYRNPADKFYWSVHDNNLEGAKSERLNLSTIPDYQVLCELAIEKADVDEPELLHWLIHDAVVHNCWILCNKLVKTSIVFNRQNILLYLVVLMEKFNIILKKDMMIKIAKDCNRKNMVKIIMNL